MRSFWWPQGKIDPGGQLGNLVVLKRVSEQKSGEQAQEQQGWPLVVAAQPGLLDTGAGSLAVEFTWKPVGGSRTQALFSQGGYGRDMGHLYRPPRPSGRAHRTDLGPVILESDAAVVPNTPHTAWLVYKAGDEARLILDGQEVADEDMDGKWSGSQSPYIIGASRWPGREFQGDIAKVSLWGHQPGLSDP